MSNTTSLFDPFFALVWSNGWFFGMFIATVILLLFCGICIGLGWNWHKFKEMFFKAPSFYTTQIVNAKIMDKILEVFPALTLQERLLLIQQSFGRPIRIQMGLDKNGKQWLESVSFWQTLSAEDESYHHMESFEKDKSVG